MNKFPQWLKRPLPAEAIAKMNRLLKAHNLHTVCQSARCPNIGECFKNKEATFLILGNICTRNCGFCSVKNSKPQELDLNEPARIAQALKEMGLDYVVITSVTRDDLEDGGAGHFVATINEIRRCNSGIKIEILTPDFSLNITAINNIIKAAPDIFAHNIETVPRLYATIRPQADYKDSIRLLSYAKNNSDILIKSGIILGLSETEAEVIEVIKDLGEIDCDILTIGQYLKSAPDCADVHDFIRPDKFDYYKTLAENAGIKSVISGPFVRSSYKAKQAYQEAVRSGHESYSTGNR